ncbi:hypothetical protein NZL82_17975 [Sphingomonas sanguinis]|uniref:hypothetical protein n=1 Tax=Sphingomonas sp. LC-1 TaxID=3110957 RepID=UPI0021BA5A27|nr:hypothetical protein [Sphingomonas sp. LC-1]MCT8003764.1 hypothetical protein [Sphingomonas sp. LC-1]
MTPQYANGIDDKGNMAFDIAAGESLAMLCNSTALVQQAGTAWLIARRKKPANLRFL